MGLRYDIPRSLQQQLSFKHVHLCEISQRFKTCSTDLRIDTYYETNDSNLAFTAANDNIARSYHVPIASVASAILDLDHESETPLSSDHVGCATFEVGRFAGPGTPCDILHPRNMAVIRERNG